MEGLQRDLRHCARGVFPSGFWQHGMSSDIVHEPFGSLILGDAITGLHHTLHFVEESFES